MQIVFDFVMENKKKLLIVLLLIIVMGIVSFFINKNTDKKVYFSDSYVYSKEIYKHDDDLVSKLPYINIKGKEISDINTSLIKKYYEVITVDKNFINYNYYINDDILSLIVKVHSKNSPNSYPSEVLIYNVDIQNGVVLDDDELLDMFNVNSDDISEIIRDEIKEYYDYEIKKGYITSNICDFECYLNGSNSLPILDNCSYYVKDGYLFAYKQISLNSDFFYDINSGFNLFNFKIKEK